MQLNRQKANFSDILRNKKTNLGLPWGLSGKERNRQPMQETRVRSLVWEDPTRCKGSKPKRHSC